MFLPICGNMPGSKKDNRNRESEKQGQRFIHPITSANPRQSFKQCFKGSIQVFFDGFSADSSFAQNG